MLLHKASRILVGTIDALDAQASVCYDSVRDWIHYQLTAHSVIIAHFRAHDKKGTPKMKTNDEKDRSDIGNVAHCQYRFPVEVAKADFDFHPLEVEDPKVTGRQLLETAGFGPAEEHLLFHVLDNRALEELRLEETVELREKGVERFIAFRSDRSFRVEIDERRFEWGTSELTGLIAKQMVGGDPCVYRSLVGATRRT